MKLVVSAAVVLILIVACGGGGTVTPTTGVVPTLGGVQPTAVTPTAVTPTTPPVVSGAGTSIVHVVVASGPQAGTYDATGVKFDCNISPDGSGATFLDMAATEGVTSLTFSSIEGGASSTKFYFNVLFGAVSASQPVLEIQTLDPDTARGSGSASLVDNGSTIKWTIDGTASDGTGVQATVECGPVDRR
ncbi:MAG: hypothetical protein ABIP53_02420 [Candidatus Limnocylindrales bacterium]